MSMENAAETTFVYDVFVAYCTSDRPWVRSKLLPTLEKNGLRVCIDYRDFQRGEPMVVEIERALRLSRRTLLILTPDYQANEWTDIEQFLMQPDHPINRDHRVVPVLKEPYNVPPSVRTLTIIDFTSPSPTDREIAWRQIFTALDKKRMLDPPDPPRRDAWLFHRPHVPPPTFTGRVYERDMLTSWVQADYNHPLMLLTAPGGSGKSALVWHWLLHDVYSTRWRWAVWWSFSEGHTSFEHFLDATLRYANINPQGKGLRQQADEILHLLRDPAGHTLLVLDGFEHILHNRESLNPIADYLLRRIVTMPDIHGKVLLTTRLRPRAIEQSHRQEERSDSPELEERCREEPLDPLQPSDAIDMVRAQGVRGPPSELEQVCKSYGLHPLTLRLLAGIITNHPRQPGDIVLARQIEHPHDQQQQHMLMLAYRHLAPERKTLLGRIACFSEPASLDTLKALLEHPDEQSPEPDQWSQNDWWNDWRKRGIAFLKSWFAQSSELPMPPVREVSELERGLHELISRGLLGQNRQTRTYHLHPLVRSYAHENLAHNERVAFHTDIARLLQPGPEPPAPTTQHIGDLAPLIASYHHTLSSGQHDEAFALFQQFLFQPLRALAGGYDIARLLLQALCTEGTEHLPSVSHSSDQEWIVHTLATIAQTRGQPQHAAALFARVATLEEQRGNLKGFAISLRLLATQQMTQGQLQEAETNLQRSIALCRDLNDEREAAAGRVASGWILIARGAWEEAEKTLTTALVTFEEQQQIQEQAMVWALRALRAWAMTRLETPAAPSLREEEKTTALAAARHALSLIQDMPTPTDPDERDTLIISWIAGAALHINSEHDEADRLLHETLQTCHRLDGITHEADILLTLAQVRAATNKRDEARQLAQEAQEMSERCRSILQAAEARLFLAQMAQQDGNTPAAQEYAQKARDLARCDGPPNYTYKVVYDEALRLLYHGKKPDGTDIMNEDR